MIYKDGFCYHIDDSGFISSDGEKSIVYKGIQYDTQNNSIPCVLKFKSREYYSKDNILDMYDVLNKCGNVSEILDVIDDLGDFTKEYNYITINSNNYFCVVEKFIKGDTLEMFCLKFNDIGLIRTTIANQVECYYQYENTNKLVCKNKLTKKFYRNFQNKIYDFMIQMCDILTALKNAGVFPEIKAENIIVDENDRLFLVSLGENCHIQNENTDKALEDTVFSFGSVFWLCLSIMEIFTDEKNSRENSKKIINHEFPLESITDFSLPKACAYDTSLRKIINRCTSRSRYKSYNKLKSDIKASQKSYKRNVAFKITVLVLSVLILAGAGCMLLLSMKEKSEKNKDEQPSVSEEISVNEDEIIAEAQENLKNYINDEISYDEAKAVFDGFPEIENEALNEISADFQAVFSSKESFRTGNEMYESGNYKEAIDNFSNVIQLDKNNYQSAQAFSSLALERYKSSQKQQAEEAYMSDDFKKAYMDITSLAEEFPDDSFLGNECTEKKNVYMKSWIESQRQKKIYFGEEGAVILAYSYNFFDIDGGIGNLKQEGYDYEREQLFNMINSKRAEQLSYPLVETNTILQDIAESTAEIRLSTGEDPDTNYNQNFSNAVTAQGVMDTTFLNYNDCAPFYESSHYIGIGICFNEQENNLLWVILSAMEDDSF